MNDQTDTSPVMPGSPTVDVSTGGETSGPRHSDFLVTPGSRATGRDETRDVHQPVPWHQRRAIPSYLVHRVQLHLKRCIEDVDRILDEDDPVLRTNSYEQFKRQLEHLWQIRTEREPEFREFVNLIQMLFVDRDVGSFSDTQLRSVRDVLQQARDTDEFDDRLNDELTEQLIRGGLDVFRELA